MLTWQIELLTSAGGPVEHTTQLKEPPLDPDTDDPEVDPDILAPYNAYSASGVIEVRLSSGTSRGEIDLADSLR